MSRVLFVGDPHLDSRTPLSRIDDYRVTTINKLDNLLTLAVRKKVNYVVMTGDMFHRFDIPMSYLNEVLRMLKKFKAENIEVYSLIGNHDLPHNTMEYFNRTPLAVLFASGLVKSLGSFNIPSVIMLDNTVIHGLNFTESIDNVKLIEGKKSILVMHYATENTVPADNVPLEDLKPFDWVIAGHDHMYYPPLIRDGVRVFRPGSLTRRSKEQYNLDRQIKVVLFDERTNSMSEHNLPNQEPAINVFRDKVFTRDVENLYDNSYSKLFSDLSADREYTDIFEILEDLPPDVKDSSIKSIIKFLEIEGITQDLEEIKKIKDEFADAFSIEGV